MCGRLGHERQVEVWIVGGVEEDLPQHGTPRAQRLRLQDEKIQERLRSARTQSLFSLVSSLRQIHKQIRNKDREIVGIGTMEKWLMPNAA